MITEQPSDKAQQKSSPQKPSGILVNPGIQGFPGISGLMQPFPSVQAFYANGFDIAVTGPDVLVTLSQNGRVLMTLNLSFTTAKALGRGLASMMSDLEEKSQTKVLFVDEIAKALDLAIGEKQ
jgi:hypothetical protein